MTEGLEGGIKIRTFCASVEGQCCVCKNGQMPSS